MKYIYEPVKVSLAFPKEVLEYLVRLKYLQESNSFSGDICIKSYTATPLFVDVIVKQMLVRKDVKE